MYAYRELESELLVSIKSGSKRADTFCREVARCFRSKTFENVGIDDPRSYLQRITGLNKHSLPNFDSPLRTYASNTKQTDNLRPAIALYYATLVDERLRHCIVPIERSLFHNHDRDALFARLECWERGDKSWKPKAEPVGLIEANKRPLAEISPELSDPENSGQPYHFSSDQTDPLGREAELSALQRFCDASAKFKWWQISGEAGLGKSRIAFHFVKELEDEYPQWSAGFLDSYALAEFADQWEKWQPQHPHLLVVDDVLSATTELKTAMQGLAIRDDLEQPVRLLLIERQPWNFGGFQEDISTGRADWYCQLTAYPTGHDAKLDYSRFDDEDGASKEVLRLTGLSPENLIQITHQAAKKSGQKLLHSDDAIAKVLERVDPDGRPLFAFFVGRALVEGQVEATENSTELLNWILTDNRYRRWEPSFKSIGLKTPQIGSASPVVDGYSGLNPAMHLVILATMIGGVDVNEMEYADEWTQHNFDVLTQAHILADGPLTDNPGTFIPPIGPHILGEWFVVQSISRQRKFFDLVELAWKSKPEEMAAFVVRLASDFPRNKTVERIIAHMPELEDAQKIYASFAYDVLKSLHTNGCEIPKILVLLLKQRAAEGDVIAMHALGYCCSKGLGLPVDHVTAAKWEKSAAVAGHPIAMNNYGARLQVGQGVPKNPEAAMEWYRKSADMGYARAMANIAWAFLKSDEIGVDTAEAMHWIEKAMELDRGYPLFLLGYCHERGYEVPEDPGKAIELYEEAAANQCAEAMHALGYLYHHGNIVEPDVNTAIYWYEQAVARLNPAAMNNLAHCYWANEGVERDYEKAIVLYKRSAELGYAKAMYNLGCCYDYGHGVEPNPETAFKYYKMAAELKDYAAMNSQAICYRDGYGVEPNQPLAFEMFETSASQGNPNAMYNLAEFYAKGLIGPPDIAEAISWHEKALQTGHEPSRQRLKELMQQ